MMKTTLRLLKWMVIVVGVLVIALVSFIHLSWDKTYEAEFPAIQASSDSAVIARGKYLAFGPAHCSTCHVPMDQVMAVEDGLEMPLQGGWELTLPPGTFRAPNITPHPETGIGKADDATIARSLRYSVSRTDRCVFPFMPFQELSDEDLTAVISFLRSQPAVDHKVEKSELTFLGKAVMAFGMIKPVAPKQTPPRSVVREPTAAYGSYLANSVANCVGCHTARDLKTGAFIGEPFAGGMYFEPDPFSGGRSFISPNLTPDPTTGIMAGWTEDQFVTRLKSGRVHKGSPMPWGAFSRIDTVDLQAIYRYLTSLEPVAKSIPKIVFENGEKPVL